MLKHKRCKICRKAILPGGALTHWQLIDPEVKVFDFCCLDCIYSYVKKVKETDNEKK